jgi:hypothetical protein
MITYDLNHTKLVLQGDFLSTIPIETQILLKQYGDSTMMVADPSLFNMVSADHQGLLKLAKPYVLK